VLECFADWSPERIRSHEARFIAPVYPGETLEVSMWLHGDAVLSEASIPGRATKVLTFGRTGLRQ
jgi:acyl dehydratase